MSTLNVIEYGQVFTPDHIVDQMLGLLRNPSGRTMEPSAGAGAFSRRIPECVAIELDPRVAPEGALVMDFFAYPETEQFDRIIGNPPYVRHQDILPDTKALLASNLFDRRSNLALFFIEKCIRHLKPGGELVLIVPREIIKLTSARRLNAFIYSQGTITDFVETGDTPIFGKYVPNCAIFRFEKGLFDRTMTDGRIFREVDGQLMFLQGEYTIPFSALFDVKVGAVSGADDVFTHPEGNMDFVCSKTIDTGATRRMIFGVKHPHLNKFKTRLLARGVRSFDSTNWWQWGRSHYMSDRPRIYVNGRTRRPKPFFIHECQNWDGSIYAIFPKDPSMDLEKAKDLLNNVDWQELGFVCDGRFLCTQRSLATCMLPESFRCLMGPKAVISDSRPRPSTKRLSRAA